MNEINKYEKCPCCGQDTSKKTVRTSSYRPGVAFWQCTNSKCMVAQIHFSPCHYSVQEFMEYLPLRIERNDAFYERMRVGKYTSRLQAAQDALENHYIKYGRTPAKYRLAA